MQKNDAYTKALQAKNETGVFLGLADWANEVREEFEKHEPFRGRRVASLVKQLEDALLIFKLDPKSVSREQIIAILYMTATTINVVIDEKGHSRFDGPDGIDPITPLLDGACVWLDVFRVKYEEVEQ